MNKANANHISFNLADYDVGKIRADFPILSSQVGVGKKPLVYFDNAATAQKPDLVLDVLNDYYSKENANIHRGVHYLSAQATDAYDDAREKMADFINAPSSKEIVFVRGTTEGINLVAHSFGQCFFRPGDNVVISAMEHHANIVPWQMARDQYGIELRIIPMDDRAVLDLDAFEKLLDEKTKLISIVHISNALGTINPVKSMIKTAQKHDIPVLLDGAQSVPHFQVDVTELDCDFFTFSGHKLFGPTGIGVLYGKMKWLEAMPPYQGGGDMIKSVTFEKTHYRDPPERFEAGTPHIAGVIGLAAAVEWLNGQNRELLALYEADLLDYGHAALGEIPGLRLIGTAPDKAGILSFHIKDIHPHDVGTFLDSDGIAIRSGHHCAQPVMDFFGITGTARASLAFYNTRAEIDKLSACLHKIVKFFG